MARLFEGQQAGALTRWLENHPGHTFQDAWNRGLTDGERRNYEEAFGRNACSTLASLSEEQNPELFGTELLRIAGQLENSERLEAASLLYQSLQSANLSASLSQRSRTRLDAIQGRGDNWTRAGFLGHRVLAQASEPSALVGMGVAGMVGRAVRLGMLSRLAVSPAGALTRGLGARALASTTALALEAPAFTASTRGMNVLLGRPQDWSGRAIWREFAGGATTLLGLKLSGALGGNLIRRYAQGESLLARGGRVAISQTAMIGGIYASHRAEQALGFRDQVSG
ncbi:MAG TPA: hypothetical protein VFW62_10195, partial [bacterium]|nr:hypothetical protein [bacterium]